MVTMGNDILSSDMLVGGLVRSVYNCFQFKDYMEGCRMLYDLNNFLLGFGFGITDMMKPKDPMVADVRDRVNPNLYYQGYRDLYASAVMKALGKYNREMIDAIKHKEYVRPY